MEVQRGRECNCGAQAIGNCELVLTEDNMAVTTPFLPSDSFPIAKGEGDLERVQGKKRVILSKQQLHEVCFTSCNRYVSKMSLKISLLQINSSFPLIVFDKTPDEYHRLFPFNGIFLNG